MSAFVPNGRYDTDNPAHPCLSNWSFNPALSTDDIALAMGFSDAARFRHAFKRWAATTPNEVRGHGDPALRPSRAAG
ncbi:MULTISPECIES: helix-turn-helix domain-containing protein [Burkholderia]